MRAVLADTGPLYALVDRHDQLHVRARTEASRLARQKWTLVAAFPTVLESHSLILRRLGIPAARKWLDEVLTGIGLLNPVDEDYLAAAKRIRSYADQPITLFDGLVAVIAGQLEIPVWTFDHHFAVMGVTVWP
ncbi:MAG TPA: PIN domain-containing protein [Thermoanaerobaculia bacterium]|nr:PIN domain-containing protein [Thermoanaerobaculia bacterium]